MKNARAVLKQAIEIYGAEAQLNVAIEEFADIAADYPALTTDDLEAIRESLNLS